MLEPGSFAACGLLDAACVGCVCSRTSVAVFVSCSFSRINRFFCGFSPVNKVLHDLNQEVSLQFGPLSASGVLNSAPPPSAPGVLCRAPPLLNPIVQAPQPSPPPEPESSLPAGRLSSGPAFHRRDSASNSAPRARFPRTPPVNLSSGPASHCGWDFVWVGPAPSATAPAAAALAIPVASLSGPAPIRGPSLSRSAFGAIHRIA